MLRNVLVAMLVLWLGLMGVVFGFLCLACVVLLLFWQGLGLSTFLLGLLCLSCLGLAFVLAGKTVKTRVVGTRKKKNSIFGRIRSALGSSDERGMDLEHDLWRHQVPDYEDLIKRADEKHQ